MKNIQYHIFSFIIIIILFSNFTSSIKTNNNQNILDNLKSTFPLLNSSNLKEYTLDHRTNICENTSINCVPFLSTPYKPLIIKDINSPDNNYCLISKPLAYDVLRAGDDIDVTGSITGEGFVSYSVKYGVGLEPTEWYDEDIILTDGGQHPIINDVIAIWNTSSIVEPGFYTLKITVNSNEQKIFYVKDLHLDPTLKQGWPQRIPWYNEYDPELEANVSYFGGAAQPVLSDIDNDNESEIIVYVAGNPTRIYAYNPDGGIVDGWPVFVGQERMPGAELEAPAIGDLDGDGWKEIIVNGFYGLYAYNHDGSLRFTISFSEKQNVPSSVVLFDLNNNGQLEIIKKVINYTDGFEKIVVFNSTGHIMGGWPQNIYEFIGLNGDNHIDTDNFGLTPSIGNFDEDDEWEIVVGTVRNEYADISKPDETFHHEGRVYVFNLDGSILEGFPVDVDGEIAWSSPVVADIDNDGYDNIIIGTKMEDSYPEKFYSNPNTGLYVIDRSGEIKSGWPQLKGESIYTTPAIADFNNDGFLEIVVSTYNVNRFDGVEPATYVFDAWGEILPGWPQETVWNDYHSPVVADINCDGSLDIVVSAGNGYVDANWNQPGNGGVYAWNIDGSMIDGFPKVTEVDAQAAPCIKDLDNDGIVEVVASSMYDMDIETTGRKKRSSIYVWEVGSSFNDSSLEWPMYSYDSGYSGRYISRNITNFTPRIQIEDDIRCPTKPFVYGQKEHFFVSMRNPGNQEVDAFVVFRLWDSSKGEWEFFGESNCIISPGSSNSTDPNHVFLSWSGRIWEIEKIRVEVYVNDELVDTQENLFFLWFFIV